MTHSWMGHRISFSSGRMDHLQKSEDNQKIIPGCLEQISNHPSQKRELFHKEGNGPPKLLYLYT